MSTAPEPLCAAQLHTHTTVSYDISFSALLYQLACHRCPNVEVVRSLSSMPGAALKLEILVGDGYSVKLRWTVQGSPPRLAGLSMSAEELVWLDDDHEEGDERSPAKTPVPPPVQAMSSSTTTDTNSLASGAVAAWEDEAFCIAFANVAIAEPAPAPEPEEEYEYEGHFSTRDLKYMYTQAVLKDQPDFAAALLKRYGEHLADSPALMARELFFPPLPESEGMARVWIAHLDCVVWEEMKRTPEFAEALRVLSCGGQIGGLATRMLLSRARR
ncbi:hypothetical protein JCM8097_004967 [Rhodosporidiobolus ruineniae]